MIKKHFLVFAATAAIFTVSCASTPSPDPKIENTEEKSPDENPLATVIEQNLPENIKKEPQPTEKPDSSQIPKNQISEEPESEPNKIEDNLQNEMESSSQTNLQTSSKANENKEIIEKIIPEEKEFEKVAEEDLPFEKQSENAPLEAESKIFPEPNVIDIAEEPEVFEENHEIPEPENEKQNLQNEESENTESSELEKEETADADSENPIKTENTDEIKNIEEKAETIQNSGEANAEKNGIETIIPSREVTIKRNQYLDVVYPGNGWIYIGEEKTPALLTYFGRITDSSSTAFTLHSGEAGETFLHFYKNDALTGKSIDDYLLVTVEDKIASPDEKTLAPSYAQIVPPQFQKRQSGIFNDNGETGTDKNQNQDEKSKQSGINIDKNDAANSKAESKEKSYVQNPRENRENQEFSSSDVKTLVSTPEKQNPAKNSSSSSSENLYAETGLSKSNLAGENLSIENGQQPSISLEPEVQTADAESESGEELLEKAKSLFEEKKYAESLESCLECINASNGNLDEAYYLLGQIYEAESPVKNIRNALDAYTAVTKNYPLSKLWQKAKERSVYLRRFYIDIR